MSQPPSDGDPQRFEVRLTSDSHFSWLRTKLSMDRTLMAAERTAIAMIGFGFTIVQFFERFGDMEGVRPLRPQTPRYIGLALIAAGTITMAIAIWQYRWGSTISGAIPTERLPASRTRKFSRRPTCWRSWCC